MPLTRPTSATSPPGAPAGVVTPPAATSEAVASGGSVTGWTFGAFTDPDSRIASYSATLVTVTGSGSLSGTGLGPYSITGTADGDAYTVELDALDSDGGVLATAVHTVTIEGEGLADPTSTPSAADYVIGGYHDFDGTDERIDFGLIPALEFDASSTFTISFWVYKDTAATGSIVLSYDFGTTTVSTGEGWFINWTTTTVTFFTRDLGSVYTRGISQPGTNTWHHVVFVFAAGSFSAYLNGASASVTGSGTLFDNIDYTNVTDARIGNIQTGSLPFPGRIAEVAIWGSDQSANIAAIYNCRERHDLMDLTTPPDLFYAPLTSYGDDPDPATTDGVFEAVAGNDGTGVNMETADAVIPTVTEISSTLTKAINVSTSVVTTTKVENVVTGATGGTGSSFP